MRHSVDFPLSHELHSLSVLFSLFRRLSQFYPIHPPAIMPQFSPFTAAVVVFYGLVEGAIQGGRESIF